MGRRPCPFTGARLSPSPRYPSPQRPETRPIGAQPGLKDMELAKTITDRGTEAGLTVCSAESCAGGPRDRRPHRHRRHRGLHDRHRGPGKPVGTVWFAVNSARGTSSIRQLFEGDSMAVQEQAIAFALDLIIEELDAGA